MSVLHFLYDVLTQREDGDYSEWLDAQAQKSRRAAEREEEREESRHRDRQRRALEAEHAAILKEGVSAEEDHHIERKKLHIRALREEALEHPERLAQGREVEAETRAVSRKLVWKKDAAEKDIDLEEARRKLERVEADVRAERARKANPAGSSATPVTPYLSDKEMLDMVAKTLRRIKALPAAKQETSLKEWREDLGLEYGPLVAEEMVQNVRYLLED